MSRSLHSISRQLGMVLVGLGLILAISGTIPAVNAQSTGSCANGGPATCQNYCANCTSSSRPCYKTSQYCDYTQLTKVCVSPISPASQCTPTNNTTCGNVRYCWNKTLATDPSTGALVPCTQTVPYCTGNGI